MLWSMVRWTALRSVAFVVALSGLACAIGGATLSATELAGPRCIAYDSALDDVVNFASNTKYRSVALPNDPQFIIGTPLTPQPPIYNYPYEVKVFERMCREEPFLVIRGLQYALNIDLTKFETNALLSGNKNAKVQCYSYKNGDGDLKLLKVEQWTLQKYANYQNKALENGKTNIFGMMDLDSNKWPAQADELDKLPNFLKASTSDDFLSHVGHPIAGVNAVQVFIKVNWNRTGLHQEDCVFCSVNWNIGPSVVKWYFIDFKYWGQLFRYAQSIGVDFFSRLWWPELNELHKRKIPVYTVYHKVGDLIFTNTGTLHWVVSEGPTNNITWNVSVKDKSQYINAMERYEFLKTMGKPNVVPMIHLIWNLAREASVKDSDDFFYVFVDDLRTSLMRVMATQRYLQSINKKIEQYDREIDEVYQTCSKCQDELFNYIFVDKRRKVRCLKCVDDISKFDCLEEFRINELMGIYDKNIGKDKGCADILGILDITQSIAEMKFELPDNF